MASVQFIGIEEALNAFSYRGVDIWAIYDGKRLMHKGSGENDLREFLEMISKSGTSATYILKVYEDLTDAKEVKSNTADDGSFNFKLFPAGEQVGGRGIIQRHYGYPSFEDRVAERLDKIEGLLLNDDDTEDSQDETFAQSLGNAFIGMIQQPDKLGQFIDSLQKLFATGNNHVARVPVIGQVEINRMGQNANDHSPAGEIHAANMSQVPTEEKLQRLGSAIDTLEQHDPQLVEHLEKLATIAAKTPERFKAILSIFDAS
jgi:hypothetical protein